MKLKVQDFRFDTEGNPATVVIGIALIGAAYLLFDRYISTKAVAQAAQTGARNVAGRRRAADTAAPAAPVLPPQTVPGFLQGVPAASPYAPPGAVRVAQIGAPGPDYVVGYVPMGTRSPVYPRYILSGF